MPERAVRAFDRDVAAGGTVLLTHERYVLELQPSDVELRSTAELQLGSSSSPGSVELRMPRAWKLAFVVVLSTADGIRSRCRAGCTCAPLLHAALQESVAAETTCVSDIEVRSQDDTRCACFPRRFCFA